MMMAMLMSDNELRYQMSDNELRYQTSDNELRYQTVMGDDDERCLCLITSCVIKCLLTNCVLFMCSWNVFGGLLEASRGHLGETQNHLKTSPKTPSISDTFISQ